MVLGETELFVSVSFVPKSVLRLTQTWKLSRPPSFFQVTGQNELEPQRACSCNVSRTLLSLPDLKPILTNTNITVIITILITCQITL